MGWIGLLVVAWAAWRYWPELAQTGSRLTASLGRGRRLKDLKVAAAQIGNAHQYLELAEALAAADRWDEAEPAYETAVAKDGDALAAKWGLAVVRFRQRRWDEAASLLRAVLSVDPRYKFGDVSLLLGKTYASAGQTEVAREHLQDHTRLWREPEAMYLLARMQRETGDTAAAAKTLDGLLLDLDSDDRVRGGDARRWRRLAKQLRSELPPTRGQA